MSMYNMVHGTSPTAPIVFMLLDRPAGHYGRVRDAWVEKNTAGELRLVVYTRNGGGNREHFADEDAGPECSCTGCTITYRLPKDPLYLSDEDDTYDSTYAKVYFKVPDDVQERLVKAGAPIGFKLEEIAIDAPNMQERWEAAVDAIRTAPLAAEILPIQQPHEEKNYESVQAHPGDQGEGQNHGVRRDTHGPN